MSRDVNTVCLGFNGVLGTTSLDVIEYYIYLVLQQIVNIYMNTTRLCRKTQKKKFNLSVLSMLCLSLSLLVARNAVRPIHRC